MKNSLLKNILKRLKDKFAPPTTGRDIQVIPPPRIQPSSILGPSVPPVKNRDIELPKPNVFDPLHEDVKYLPTIPMQMPSGQPNLIPTRPPMYDQNGTPAPQDWPLNNPYDPDFYRTHPIKASPPGLKTPQKQRIIKSAIKKI